MGQGRLQGDEEGKGKGLPFPGHIKKVLLSVGSAKHNQGRDSEPGSMNLVLTPRGQIR